MENKNLREWWYGLEEQWKLAFNEGFFGKGKSPALPSEQELRQLAGSPALRMVGPKGPYPNLSFELTNISGIAQLTQLETLVVGYCQVPSLEPLKALGKLSSLFLFGNRLRSLEGIQHLVQLQELYVNVNELKDLRPIEPLTRLRSLYCNYNQLESLEGLTKKHAKAMKQFVCLPNEELPDAEILRVEQELRIRCQRG